MNFSSDALLECYPGRNASQLKLVLVELLLTPDIRFTALTILICVPMLTLQLSSLPIFLIYRNYRQNVCFRILFTNGAAECLELLTMLAFAILNLLLADIPVVVHKIGGAVAIVTWSLVVFQHLLLAMNRLIVILRARYLGSKWVPDEEREACMFNIAHLLLWGLYLAVLFLFNTNLMGALYHRRDNIFIFDNRTPHINTYRAVNDLLTNICTAICFCIYIAIIWNARKSRQSIRGEAGGSKSKNGGKTAGNESPPLLSDYERRLLIQALILYSLMTLLINGWGSIEQCNCKDEVWYCRGKFMHLIPLTLTYEMHTLLIEVPWLLYCGLNPILFLTMNREFRNRYLNLYGANTRKISHMLTSSTFLPNPCLCKNQQRRRKMTGATTGTNNGQQEKHGMEQGESGKTQSQAWTKEAATTKQSRATAEDSRIKNKVQMQNEQQKQQKQGEEGKEKGEEVIKD